MLGDQEAALRLLGIRSFGDVVVDSAMSFEEALGDDVVAEQERAFHEAIKPLLRMVPVAYWGLDVQGRPDGKYHVGQILIHEELASDVSQIFAKMFELRFPLHSVIPHSAFGYDDPRAMAANNTSGYRPDELSEHTRGAAVDFNPVQNPFDRSAYDSAFAVEPAGAVYDIGAPGTLVMDSELRRFFTHLGWEWGGNWGNPQADPQIDFFRPGFFDYQHIQLNARRIDSFNARLPQILQG